MTHAARAHAKLAPSAAHRWMNCPGSVRLSAGIENKAGRAADEGTAAHMLAEHCLESGIDAAKRHGAYISIREETGFHADGGDGRFMVDDEMVEGVQMYLDYVRDLFDRCDFYWIEERLDLRHLHPELWGTGDAGGYEEAIQHLHVIDFKYGKGIAVDPAENEQLLCYGSGAARNSFAGGREVRKVTLHVIQPRAPHKDGPKRKWTATLTQLRDFDRRAKLAAEATDAPNAQLKAGDWCTFCPARGGCPARRDAVMANAQIEFGTEPAPVETLSADEIGDRLPGIKMLAKYCEDFVAHALDMAINGQTPRGHKLVAKRAVRRWKDEDHAAKIMRALFDLSDDEIFTRKMVSPAGAEKLVGKGAGKQLAEYQTKTSSGVTLAPLDDPREPVSSDPSVEFAE